MSALQLSAQELQPFFRHIADDEGFSHDLTSYHLLEDTFGFIWSTGPSGMVKFDGQASKAYSGIMQGLSEMGHIKGVQDSKGRLWFISYSGVLSCYEKGGFKVFEDADTFKHLLGRNNCVSLFIDSNDIVHMGLKRNGYVQYDPHKKELVSVLGQETNQFGLYIGRKGGKPFAFTLLPSEDADTVKPLPIFRYRMAQNENRSTVLGYFPEVKSITDLQDKMDVRLTERANGNVLLSAKNFLLELSQDTVFVYNTVVQMRSILEDDYGGLWLANAQSKGIHYFPSGKYASEGGKKFLPDVHVHTVLKDRFGGIWLGTRNSGLYHSAYQYVQQTLFPDQYSNLDSVFHLQNPVFFASMNAGTFNAYDGTKAYTYRINRSDKYVNSIYYQKDSQRLYMCNLDSLLILSPDGMKAITHPDFYFIKRAGHVKEYQGSIWVSSGHKVFRIAGDSLIEEYPLSHQRIRDFCWYDNQLFIGTQTGIYRAQKGGDNWFSMNEVHNCFEGRSDHLNVFNNALWVFNFQKGVFAYDGDNVVQIRYPENYAMRNVVGSGVRNEAMLIIGSSDCITEVSPDSISPTGYSLSHVPLPIFDRKDAVNELYTVGEQVVFPNNGYLVSFTKNRVRQIPKIRLLFKGARVNGVSYATDTVYSVPYDSNNISLYYMAISHHSGGASSYRYRVNPDQDWIYTQNTNADLNYLSPGTYEFQLFVRNTFLQTSPIRSVSITIRPPYYRTWWFQLSVVIVLVLVVWRFFKWRIGQVRRRSQLLEDLHSSQHQSLAARMNPHFIFNSLSAIHQYTLSNNKEEAAEYMTEYAQLMRLVMDNAGRALVELQSELEAIEIYLKLERLRSKGKVDYALRLDSEVDTGETLIPALLIWPYLENAIWHGLMPREEGDGLLSVRFLKKGAGLLVEVEDNGIGRNQAAALATGNHPGFESQGMNMTEQRVDLIRKIYKVDIKIEVEDLYQNTGAPSGTLVQLYIPSFDL